MSTKSQNKEWPMLRRDAAYSGSDGTHIQAPLEKIWEFKAHNKIESPPAVAYGLVFFGSTDKNIYAVDIATGEQKWIFKTGNKVHSSPVVANGVVYVGSVDKNIYALDAKTGEKLWEYRTGKPICETLAVGHGMVFFGCGDKHIYAIDAKTGQKRWKFKSDYKDHSVPMVAKGKVLISGKGFRSCTLYAIDATSGNLVWKQKDYQAKPRAVLVEDFVLVHDNKKRMKKLDLECGAERPNWKSVEELHEVSSVIWHQGLLLVTVQRPGVPGLYAFKMPNIGETWRTELEWIAPIAEIGYSSVSAPLICGEFAFITTTYLKVYGINLFRLMHRWEFTVKDIIESHPVAADGIVLLTTREKILAFRGAKDKPTESDLEKEFSPEVPLAIKPYGMAGETKYEVKWPNCCCLCCGPAQTVNSVKTTYRPMIGAVTQSSTHIIPNVPYCNSCSAKVNKFLRGEPKGVTLNIMSDVLFLSFRNPKYLLMFKELNQLR